MGPWSDFQTVDSDARLCGAVAHLILVTNKSGPLGLFNSIFSFDPFFNNWIDFWSNGGKL